MTYLPSPDRLRGCATLLWVGVTLGVAGCLGNDSGLRTQQAALGNQGASLAGLYRGLSDLQSGRIERLNILQIGDSHTAADSFSGKLRNLFQDRFGNAGRGALPPGTPFPYWRPRQVKVTQVGGWEVLSSNRTDFPSAPYGISGFILRSRGKSSSIGLAAEAAFDSAEISYFRQPSGGHIDVRVDGTLVGEIDTRGSAYQLDHKAFSLSRGASTLELKARGDGSVDIADWAIYRRERGVTLASEGFIGAEIGIMDRWSSANVATQLKELAPALIILAFGTNEGFDSAERLSDYGSVFESRIRQLQAAAPRASIVVVGPPDANRLPSYCGSNRASRDAVSCAPLTSAESADYTKMLARRDRQLCRWHTPPTIAYVREQQRLAAARTGVLFWDWSSVQGGECGATRWALEGLGNKDRIHMTEGGYEQSGDRLFEELTKGYGRH